MTLGKSYGFSKPKFPHMHLHKHEIVRVVKGLKKMIHMKMLSTFSEIFEGEGKDEAGRKQKVRLIELK